MVSKTSSRQFRHFNGLRHADFSINLCHVCLAVTQNHLSSVQSETLAHLGRTQMTQLMWMPVVILPPFRHLVPPVLSNPLSPLIDRFGHSAAEAVLHSTTTQGRRKWKRLLACAGYAPRVTCRVVSLAGSPLRLDLSFSVVALHMGVPPRGPAFDGAPCSAFDLGSGWGKDQFAWANSAKKGEKYRLCQWADRDDAIFPMVSGLVSCGAVLPHVGGLIDVHRS
jgi:hypothetical protein